jgi:hypothetical protein
MPRLLTIAPHLSCEEIIANDLSAVEAADLLNLLKVRCKKSRIDLVDIQAVLQILRES